MNLFLGAALWRNLGAKESTCPYRSVKPHDSEARVCRIQGKSKFESGLVCDRQPSKIGLVVYEFDEELVDGLKPERWLSALDIALEEGEAGVDLIVSSDTDS